MFTYPHRRAWWMFWRAVTTCATCATPWPCDAMRHRRDEESRTVNPPYEGWTPPPGWRPDWRGTWEVQIRRGIRARDSR